MSKYCDLYFDKVFKNVINNDRSVILHYYKLLVNHIAKKINVSVYDINEEDYYGILSLLLPAIDNWNELENITNIKDLFTKSNFIINNQGIEDYSLETIIKNKYK